MNWWRREGLPFLLVASAYLAMALLFTYPLISCWNTCLLGDQELPAFMWRGWWMQVVGKEGCLVAGSWLDKVAVWILAGHYPEAGNLTDMTVGLPLQHWFGYPAAQNLKCLLVLEFNALAGFMLGRGVCGSRAAGFLAGAVLAFNPYVAEMINIGRVREAIVGFEALGALYLWKVLRSPQPPSVGDAGAAGLSLSLAALFYWFYGHFLVLLALLWMPLSAARARRALVAAWVAAIVVLPNLAPYVCQYRAGDLQKEMLAAYSAVPPLQVLNSVPPAGNTDYLLNSLRRMPVESRTAEYLWDFERPDGLSLVVLALAVLSVPLAWRRAWPWLLCGVCYYVLSLGPYLRWHDSFVLEGSGGIKLPYALCFHYVPFFSRLYAPNRAESMLLVALAVLAATSLTELWRMVGAARLERVAALGLVLCGLFMPAWVVHQLPLRFTVAQPPACYDRLRALPGAGGVVELPTNSNADDTNFYQTLHQRPLLGGWAMPPPTHLSPRWRQVANSLEDLQETSREVEQALHQGVSSAPLLTRLRQGGVRFMVVHERFYLRWNPDQGSQEFRQVCAALEAVLGTPADTDREARPEAVRYLPPGWAEAAPYAEIRVYDLERREGRSPAP